MKKIRMGLGFATGRKSFKKVLFAHINVWNAVLKRIPKDIEVSLHLFVAYDLDYLNTMSTDYTNLSQEIVDAFESTHFYGAKNALKSIEQARKRNDFTDAELKSVFGSGYAGKRNAILFAALENHMDCLLFLDDDEYPMAVTNNKDFCLWSGQNIILSHLNEIEHADYTNGQHCGYISPIPQIQFNNILGEEDFRIFIEAISNDIINWGKMKELMKSGGITYASTDVILGNKVTEVPEIGGCRFISGANLCINLMKPERTFAFYNPPGARGEDTFLSTMLHDRRVYQIPCYAFHDGFSIYHRLLDGVLPIHLEPITASSPAIVTRFLNACIGWVRYKPLLVYITAPDQFEQEMASIRQALSDTLPKLSGYFGNDRFNVVLEEFEKYSKNVKRHYRQMELTQSTWQKLLTIIL